SGLSAAERPNVIIFMVDDMGPGDFKAFNPQAGFETPKISDLVLDGISFEHAHATSASCAPTRYGILTGNRVYRGRRANATWTVGGGSQILPGQDTIANMLGDSGYSTAFYGKLHLGGVWGSNKYTEKVSDGPTEHGFDYSLVLQSGIQAGPYAFFKNDLMSRWNDNSKEFEHFSGPEEALIHYSTSTSRMDNYSTETVGPLLVHDALKYIDSHNEEHQGNKPFFIHFCSQAGHGPHSPPDYFNVNDPMDTTQGIKIKGETTNNRTDMVYEADVAVGLFVEKLKELGLYENTLFIFTSDNGVTYSSEEWSNHKYTDMKLNPDREYGGNWTEVTDREGNSNHVNAQGVSGGVPLRGFKNHPHEGGHRVPLIMNWPAKIINEYNTKQVIGLQDIYRTIAGLLEINVSAEQAVDSYDFSESILRTDNSLVRNSMIIQSGRLAISASALNKAGTKRSWGYYNVEEEANQTQIWKAIVNSHKDSPIANSHAATMHEAFDLTLDPGEEFPLADTEREATILSNFKTDMQTLRASYTLSVDNNEGSFSDDFFVDSKVYISAVIPENKTFLHWTSANAVIDDSTNAQTFLRMPGNDCVVTAVLGDVVTGPSSIIMVEHIFDELGELNGLALDENSVEASSWSASSKITADGVLSNSNWNTFAAAYIDLGAGAITTGSENDHYVLDVVVDGHMTLNDWFTAGFWKNKPTSEGFNTAIHVGVTESTYGSAYVSWNKEGARNQLYASTGGKANWDVYSGSLNPATSGFVTFSIDLDLRDSNIENATMTFSIDGEEVGTGNFSAADGFRYLGFGSRNISRNVPELATVQSIKLRRIISEGSQPVHSLVVEGDGGLGSGVYAGGAVIDLEALVPAGKQFVNWTSSAGSFSDANAISTSFTMPASAATVSAHFEAIPTYTLTVFGDNGNGSGSYEAGAVIDLEATVSLGQQFLNWSSTSGTFTNAYSVSTEFTMPAENVTVWAHTEQATGTSLLVSHTFDGSGELNAKVLETNSVGASSWSASSKVSADGVISNPTWNTFAAAYVDLGAGTITSGSENDRYVLDIVVDGHMTNNDWFTAGFWKNEPTTEGFNSAIHVGVRDSTYGSAYLSWQKEGHRNQLKASTGGRTNWGVYTGALAPETSDFVTFSIVLDLRDANAENTTMTFSIDGAEVGSGNFSAADGFRYLGFGSRNISTNVPELATVQSLTLTRLYADAPLQKADFLLGPSGKEESSSAPVAGGGGCLISR
ncbi:MAG: sulfatase-like hydrolase/transferase, partial [Planctomycetes bacterium]|nr:sulfatase-like hydrolase/transferase [Planctomycetota bacterium]